MKIFIPTIGVLGDVKPLLTLAKELRKSGHQVWIGAHARFIPQINAEGIETVEIGGDIELALATTPDGIALRQNPNLFRANLVKRFFSSLLESSFDGFVQGVRDADLIVLSGATISIGLSCLDKFPRTKAMTIYTFPNVRTGKFPPPPWKLLTCAANSFRSDFNRFRAKNGFAPIRFDYDRLMRSLLSKPMVTATIYSSHLLPRPSDWPENNFMVGPILPEDEAEDFRPMDDLKQFLHENRKEKILYVGFGSVTGTLFDAVEPARLIKQIQTAIGTHPCKAIVSLVGYQRLSVGSISNTNQIFYLKEPIPHAWLFPRLSAAVHHGGAGTMHTSLRYGLPTLVIPFGGDQFFNADRVYRNRLGPKPVPALRMNARNLSKAIARLLAKYPIYRHNALEIGRLIEEENGLGQCVQLIENELKSTNR